MLGWYTLQTLKIDTNTQNMISEALDWRQDYIRYKKIFSNNHQTIVVVIEGDNFEATKIASKELYNILRKDPQFISVFSFSLSEFLAKNHLLYLSLEQLADLKKEALQVAPLLSFTREDLGSFLNFLQYSTTNSQSVQRILPILKEFKNLLHPNQDEHMHFASFAEYFKIANNKSFIEILEVKPKLSYDTLFPGETVVNAIQRYFEVLKLSKKYQVSLKMTGEVPLAYEELKGVSYGTGWATLFAALLV
ncbi:MAG TPA: hypothetical protein VFP93_03380, partial [Gammaproteobacteria bacterium]|nr:hypothetical protein [Gammaproteobacteria bacterium]